MIKMIYKKQNHNYDAHKYYNKLFSSVELRIVIIQNFLDFFF